MRECKEWSTDKCPPRMTCIPHHERPFCSCEYTSEMLGDNHGKCEMTIYAQVCQGVHIFFGILSFIAFIYMLLIWKRATKQSLFKLDMVFLGFTCVTLAAGLFTIARFSRAIMMVTVDETTYETLRVILSSCYASYIVLGICGLALISTSLDVSLKRVAATEVNSSKDKKYFLKRLFGWAIVIAGLVLTALFRQLGSVLIAASLVGFVCFGLFVKLMFSIQQHIISSGRTLTIVALLAGENHSRSQKSWTLALSFVREGLVCSLSALVGTVAHTIFFFVGRALVSKTLLSYCTAGAMLLELCGIVSLMFVAARSMAAILDVHFAKRVRPVAIFPNLPNPTNKL
eukprot:c728_g1_i1.p1 GENE.c728_g1_i1~~c728_g1_i1.p1  ORF type:complete len:354 (-),score=53.12 c728_g1_i1:61-1089(-)